MKATVSTVFRCSFFFFFFLIDLLCLQISCEKVQLYQGKVRLLKTIHKLAVKTSWHFRLIEMDSYWCFFDDYEDRQLTRRL